MKINESVSNIVLIIKFHVVDLDPLEDSFEIIRKYHKWVISQSEIETYIKTYFPLVTSYEISESITNKWQSHSELIDNFYILGTFTADQSLMDSEYGIRIRRESFRYMQTHFPEIREQEFFGNYEEEHISKSFDSLAEKILKQKDDISSMIRRAGILRL